MKISGNCGGFVEPFREHMQGVECIRTKLSYKSLMLKATTGVEGYLGVTKYGNSPMVRCTTAGYQQAISIFTQEELDSPLPHAGMHIYKLHGLPWNATTSGLEELFRKAGLPKPTLIGTFYMSSSTRGVNVAVDQEITKHRLPMAKGMDIFLTLK